jgi:hypothetical protein
VGAVKFAIIDNDGTVLASFNSGTQLVGFVTDAIASEKKLMGIRKRKKAKINLAVKDVLTEQAKQLGLEAMRL